MTEPKATLRIKLNTPSNQRWSGALPIEVRDAAALPNGNIRSGASNFANPSFSGVERTTRNMTSNMTAMQYFNCQGFVEPDALQNFRTETSVQVTLTKQ